MQTAIRLIQKETVVLYPALIIGFLSTLVVGHIAKEQLPFLLFVFWLVNLFLQLVVTYIGFDLLRGTRLALTDAVLLALRTYIPALLWAALFATCGLGLLLMITQAKPLTVLYSPIALFYVSLAQVVPVLLVTKSRSIKFLDELLFLLTHRWRSFFVMIAASLMISACFLLLGKMATAMPAPFKSLVVSLLQGYSNVLIWYVQLLLWFMAKHTIYVEA